MDAKITKNRLNNFLSYEWIKIVALIVAGIVLWTLIFTVSAVRLTVGQQFKIFLHTDVTAGEKFDEFGLKLKKDKLLSYDVLEYNYEALMGDTASTILMARFSVFEGDLLIVTDSQDQDELSLFKNFIDLYGAYPIDTLMKDAKDYYESFYKDGQIDKDYLTEVFKQRMKKDNRFKTQTSFEEGLKLERERIETLKTYWQKLDNYLQENADSLINYQRYLQQSQIDENINEAKPEEKENPYGLDLTNVTGITDLFRNIDGKSQGLTLVVLDRFFKQPHLQFEVIPVICEILKLN